MGDRWSFEVELERGPIGDSEWPCSCRVCAPGKGCFVCGAWAGRVCLQNCRNHPSSRGPCEAMQAVEPEPKIAKGDSL